MWRYSRTIAYAAKRQAAKAEAEQALYAKAGSLPRSFLLGR